MPRKPRGELRGAIHHVINRGNNRSTIFNDDHDFEHFVESLRAAKALVPTRLYAFCIMSNHFHALVEPHDIDTLSRFMHRWMTKHARPHQLQTNTTGHIWQGRFRAFPTEDGEHFLTVARYILRNPVRASIVTHPRHYRWSSLHYPGLVDDWPESPPGDLNQWLAAPLTDQDLTALRTAANQQVPFGSPGWQTRIAAALGRSASPTRLGRPPKTGKTPPKTPKTGTGPSFTP